jgi:hypothetical protein
MRNHSLSFFCSLILFLVCISNRVHADSPLTSINFYGKCYLNQTEISKIQKLKGFIDKKLIVNLTDSNMPIWKKAELINALGWIQSGRKRENHIRYLKFNLESKIYKDSLDFVTHASPESLICYAYLKAMDNYHDVSEALELAKVAVHKKQNSMAINLLKTLIETQYYTLSYRWPLVYTAFTKAMLLPNLTEDKSL